jgi:MFS family permease
VQTLELGQNGQSWKISQSLPQCQVRHMLVLFLPYPNLWTVLSPLASSMFAPGIDQIAESLKTSRNAVIGCQTGFVVMLGIGPLILAPLSETFGRKPLYLICFTIFTLLQIPTALSPNLPCLITMRTLAGFFGSTSPLPLILHIC